MSKIIVRVQDFLKLEASAGILLMFAALLALIANNSFLAPYYGALLTTPMTVGVGEFEISKALVLWINDGLMAIFFFLVGLEIKREVMKGELSTFDKAALPIFAAVGGIAVPAMIYAGINWGDPETIRGWAIPAATDIAFALGILALLGTRAPVSLKILLLAVAIIDDLAAIIIIALFYTADLSVTALAFAAVGATGLALLSRNKVTKIAPYVLIGLFMWVCVLKSGVHATLAGVLTALFIPLHGKTNDEESPLMKAEHSLHPWVAFMILPIFAFANAGISFS
ncbi:MAG: Na+/H+ antiporter NhaA, partial [Pseudomonadota bacterium]